MRTALLPIVALGLLLGCSSSSSSRGNDEWLKPSPNLKAQIERQAERLPWAHRLEDRVELIRWFAGVGEPAYPVLLELAEDERTHVAGSALASLGSTGDPRLIPLIQPLEWENPDLSLRLEKARALANLGDWSQTRLLIEALRSEDKYVRAVSAKTLKGLTGETLGYEAAASAEEREASVRRWEKWWLSSQGESELLPPDLELVKATD